MRGQENQGHVAIIDRVKRLPAQQSYRLEFVGRDPRLVFIEDRLEPGPFAEHPFATGERRLQLQDECCRQVVVIILACRVRGAGGSRTHGRGIIGDDRIKRHRPEPVFKQSAAEVKNYLLGGRDLACPAIGHADIGPCRLGSPGPVLPPRVNDGLVDCPLFRLTAR